jgi:hypothetical protein
MPKIDLEGLDLLAVEVRMERKEKARKLAMETVVFIDGSRANERLLGSWSRRGTTCGERETHREGSEGACVDEAG